MSSLSLASTFSPLHLQGVMYDIYPANLLAGSHLPPVIASPALSGRGNLPVGRFSLRQNRATNVRWNVTCTQARISYN